MTIESAFLNNPPAIFPADTKDSAVTHLNFDPARNQIVDPVPGDIYVRTDALGVEYGVLAKVQTHKDGVLFDSPRLTLALAGRPGEAKNVVITAISPNGWQRADVDTSVGSLGHFVRGFVPRATEIDTLRQENLERATRAERAINTLKDDVKRVAFEYGERFDMCGQLAEALRDLGIDPDVNVIVCGTFSMTVSVPWGDHTDIEPSDYLDDIYFNVTDTEIVSE